MDEDRRIRLVRSVLGLGLTQPLDPAVMTRALGAARHDLRSAPDAAARSAWLAGELAAAGVRRNAALLVAVEDPGTREAAAATFVRLYPDHEALLDDLLGD